MGKQVILLAAVFLVGACAAGPRPPATPGQAAVQQIDVLVARQREADAKTCVTQGFAAGTSAHRECVKNEVDRRRAEIQNALRELLRRPTARLVADHCWSEYTGAFVRCFDI
ncbi:MAG: hypothetical protein HY057_06640 [Rhodospirillales bacterium]|nr:hypothetical protein [Rhodospirillales bacterium]